METERAAWRRTALAVVCSMAVLRRWSGGRALGGLVACFVALQALVAGLHAVHTVDLQLLANDLSSICHGGKSDTGVPTLPSSDHTSACCLLGCNVVSDPANHADVSSFALPVLEATKTAQPICTF